MVFRRCYVIPAIIKQESTKFKKMRIAERNKRRNINV